MKQTVIYPSTIVPLVVKGGEDKFRALSTEHILSIGKRGDKAAILEIYEKNEECFLYRLSVGYAIRSFSSGNNKLYLQISFREKTIKWFRL